MKKFTLEIKAGDKIQVGRFNESEDEITDIELVRFGHPVVKFQPPLKRHWR